MTAVEYREYTLQCDAARCYWQYGIPGRQVPRAALRKRAAKDGWTHVRSPRGRKYDSDYCKEHRPA